MISEIADRNLVNFTHIVDYYVTYTQFSLQILPLTSQRHTLVLVYDAFSQPTCRDGSPVKLTTQHALFSYPRDHCMHVVLHIVRYARTASTGAFHYY